MFDASQGPKKTIVLDFGSAPVETFSGFVRADDLPQYEALDPPKRPLQLCRANQVEDEATALFRAFGLI